MFDIRQHEKNLSKAARVLGELKSHLHTRETAAKSKVFSVKICVNLCVCAFFFKFDTKN